MDDAKVMGSWGIGIRRWERGRELGNRRDPWVWVIDQQKVQQHESVFSVCGNDLRQYRNVHLNEIKVKDADERIGYVYVARIHFKLHSIVVMNRCDQVEEREERERNHPPNRSDIRIEPSADG